MGTNRSPGISEPVTNQEKPNKEGNPNSPSLIIKPTEDCPKEEEKLPYQEGLALPSPQKQEDTKDPSREINMLRLLELEDEDERINLDDYNSDDYKQYFSDEDMLDDLCPAQAKTPEYRIPPPPPAAVTVTVKLEDENKEEEMACRRARNQKRTERRQRALD